MTQNTQWIEEKMDMGHIISHIIEYRGIYDEGKCFNEDWNEHIIPLLKDAYNKGLADAVDSAPEEKELILGVALRANGHNTCREQFINNIRSKKI